jgi:hypothetical protein
MKDRIFSHTVLQAGKVGRKLTRGIGRKPVDHPIRFLPGFHQPMSPKVGQVFGDFYLRLSQNLLKVAYTEFTVA